MEANEKKTQTVQEIGSVDISELKQKVQQLTAEDWDTEEDFELNYNKRKLNSENKNIRALRTTNHIILRFVDKQCDPFLYKDGSRWPSWEAILNPIMRDATSHLNYKKSYFPKVMLAKLPPKQFIAPHIDGNLAGHVPHKIHIPIETNEESFFYLENEKYAFKEGVAYEVNNGKIHGVVNNGETDRIHLIFECLDYDLQSEEIKHQIENRIKV